MFLGKVTLGSAGLPASRAVGKAVVDGVIKFRLGAGHGNVLSDNAVGQSVAALTAVKQNSSKICA